MPGFDFDVARQALGGLSRRQEAIANNIANVETPGFKRTTVSFESQLRQQLASQEAATRNISLGAPRSSGSASNGAHLPLRQGGSGSGGAGASAFGGGFGGVESLLGGGGGASGFSDATRNDGNEVNLDQEMTDLATTQLQFAGLSTAIATRLRTLRSVVENV